MKILFILDEFLPENTGGAANVAFELAKGLINVNHDVLVLTATYNNDLVGEIELEGVKIRRILAYPLGRLRNYKNLKNYRILKEAQKILSEYKPDIVHIHTLHHRFSYGIIGLAKEFSKAVFLTLHDVQTILNGKLYPKRKICNLNPSQDYKLSWIDRFKRDGPSYNPFQNFFIKRALKKIDKIFCVSFALKTALEANGISNMEVIHNGIDAREWPVRELRKNNILFIGRIDEAKGAKVLVKIFDAINQEVPDAELVIVGDGNFKSENKNIRILSWQYDRSTVIKIFSESKIVIVPSIYLDPFPTINLEAMAAGRPVVGTCFGGTPEIVINNETGYIVNPYNEKKLADKIIDLLKNSEKARAFGEAGYNRVKSEFSLEKMTGDYLNWYKKFWNKKSR